MMIILRFGMTALPNSSSSAIFHFMHTHTHYPKKHERWSVRTVWRRGAVEVVGAEAGGGAEFILCRVLRSVATPAHVLIMLGMRAP